MALTEQQNIPNRPTAHEPWTFRKLFGGGATTISTAFVRVFSNVFEWLLAFSVVIISVGELRGTNLSVFFYLFAFTLLIYLIIRNILNSLPKEVEEKKKK